MCLLKQTQQNVYRHTVVVNIETHMLPGREEGMSYALTTTLFHKFNIKTFHYNKNISTTSIATEEKYEKIFPFHFQSFIEHTNE